jgi:hypothetical protein
MSLGHASELLAILGRLDRQREVRALFEAHQRQRSWRGDAHDRISAAAGLSSDGGILPPSDGFEIDRSPKSWWT